MTASMVDSGRFGAFGGRYVPETLIPALDALEDAYAEALRAAGGQAELIEGAGMIHGFFDMGRWSPGAQAIITHSIERFAALLRASDL